MKTTPTPTLAPKTARFLKRFPHLDDSNVNTNCTVDLACPSCGSRGSFRAAVTSEVRLDDMGTDEPNGADWTDRSFIACNDCGHEGTFATFTFTGLDAALAAKS